MDTIELAKQTYRAYETRDRDLIESLVAPDFTFSAPPDPLLDRAGYFERCWPNAQHIGTFDPVRLIADGDEVVVTYEATRTDGTRFRNTEVLTFRAGQMVRAEVYFGWDLSAGASRLRIRVRVSVSAPIVTRSTSSGT
jgi:ketosteroid isomerase-like protein